MCPGHPASFTFVSDSDTLTQMAVAAPPHDTAVRAHAWICDPCTKSSGPGTNTDKPASQCRTGALVCCVARAEPGGERYRSRDGNYRLRRHPSGQERRGGSRKTTTDSYAPTKWPPPARATSTRSSASRDSTGPRTGVIRTSAARCPDRPTRCAARTPQHRTAQMP